MAVPVAQSSDQPRVLMCASPITAHTAPMLRIVSELHQRGFNITFIVGEKFQDFAANLGCEPIVLAPQAMPPLTEAEMTDGISMMKRRLRHFCIGSTAPQWRIVKEALETIREREPQRNVVIITETLFMGTHPLSLGAPLPKGYTSRPKVINLNSLPIIASSIDTAAFGPGLPPDSSEKGRIRNRAMAEHIYLGTS